MANRTKLTVKKKLQFLAVLGRTGNVTHACGAIGISRRSMYDAREADPEFKSAWDDAVERATDILLLEAQRRAQRGVKKPVFHKGRVCGYVREYSDSLLMFLIKGRRPEYATERREHSGPGGGPVPVSLTDRILEARKRARESANS